VGTGIGAGLISEGRLISGAHGVSGAAGWMVIDRTWRPEYGRLGCFEALGAGPALAKLGKQAWRRNRRSLIGALAQRSGAAIRIQNSEFKIQDRDTKLEITAEVVAAAARRGDRAARRAVREIGANLGLGVANIVSLLNPEVVVLGGGLAGIGNLLLAPLRKAVRQWGQPLSRRQVGIVISRLGEEAGILGAARYAFLKMEEME
jgi:glucokinase